MRTIEEHNVGFEFTRMLDKRFELTEAQIEKMLDTLAEANQHLEDLNKLMSHLNQCKETKGKADFSQDTHIRPVIDRLYAENPSMFGSGTDAVYYIWDNKGHIESTLAAIEGALKTTTNHVHQTMMRINVEYDKRIQYTEIGKKTIERLSAYQSALVANARKT